jgi:hypothetical protein
MTGTWSKQRVTALDSVATLGELLADSGAEDRRLVLAYLEAKHLLAEAFEAFAVEKYADPTVLEEVKKALEPVMRQAYPRAPDKYLRVRGFVEVHARLLAYLVPRAGCDVSAAELRMLTADAVHTERRARDLRDLGFQLDARSTAGSDVYVLRSPVPDTVAGAALLVAKNIRTDKSISPERVAELLDDLGLA